MKTFLFGILLGIGVAVGTLYAFPPVDQRREASIVSVTPNGGTSEAFHINIPTDRIMVGAPQKTTPLPAGMVWPADNLLAGVKAELFKLRDARNVVVGLASRVAANGNDMNSIEWVIHLPARGSLYAIMNPAAGERGLRVGVLRTGSREFASLTGSVSERWMADTSGDDDAPDGRIELNATYVGEAGRLE